MLTLQKNYPISIKKFFFFTKEKKIFPYISNDFIVDIDENWQKELHSKYSPFFPDLKKIESKETKTFKGFSINQLHFCVLHGVLENGEKISWLHILDVLIDKSHQSKGIGKQLISILEGICRENKIQFITGEIGPKLVEEKKNAVERRIKFFENCGFCVFQDSKVQFSEIGIKKIVE